jgi:G2/mitotic-specific cyclin-B, other
VSAAPASHPPTLAPHLHDSKTQEHSGVSSAANKTGASTNISTNRSISRARQFGKDLTNMFSFTR